MTDMWYFPIKFESNSKFANDKFYFLTQCKQRLDELSKASEKLRSDKEFMLSILKNLENPAFNNLFRYATEELKHDREFALACFSTGHLAPNDISPCIYEDKEKMANYYPVEYQNDREIAFILMCNLLHDYEAFVSNEICEDTELAKSVFYYRLKNKNYLDLYSIPKPLLDNEEILRLYIDSYNFPKNGKQFFYVSDRLKDNEEFVEYAVLKSNDALKYASKRLLTNRDFILRLVKQGVKVHYGLLELRNTPLTDDEEIARLILPNDPYYYKYLSERLRGKKEFADIGINASSTAMTFLYHAPSKYRDKLDYARILLKTGSKNEYKYMSKRIQSMPEIALLALERKIDINLISKEGFFNMDKETALKAVNINRLVYPFFSDEVRNDLQLTYTTYNNSFPNIYQEEHWYEVNEYDYRVDYDPPVLMFSLDAIGPELKADYGFTEKLVEAFLQTKQSTGFTKKELMDDYPTFYKLIDDMVWKNFKEKNQIEYDKLKLDLYSS